MPDPFDQGSLESTLEAAKAVARRYRQLTGRPLGITGEIGEMAVAQLLGLKLAPARQAGYDAEGRDGRKVQIKARCLPATAKPGQRVGSNRLDHEWDTVALILMNEEFEPLAVYEAERSAVEKELARPGSKARNERGAMAVSKFKAIGDLRWTPGREGLGDRRRSSGPPGSE